MSNYSKRALFWTPHIMFKRSAEQKSFFRNSFAVSLCNTSGVCIWDNSEFKSIKTFWFFILSIIIALGFYPYQPLGHH